MRCRHRLIKLPAFQRTEFTMASDTALVTIAVAALLVTVAGGADAEVFSKKALQLESGVHMLRGSELVFPAQTPTQIDYTFAQFLGTVGLRTKSMKCMISHLSCMRELVKCRSCAY